MEDRQASPLAPQAPQREAHKPGIVYTFYSYKGGVGRSMALANVAALLARNRRKVLVVDFDLEAPGLERYFIGEYSQLDAKLAAETEGLVDLFEKHREGKPFDWHKCLVKAPLHDCPLPVSIITAGLANDRYVKRVQGLDWNALFERHDFAAYLARLRAEWVAEFEFVLIDSRTGISDIGGICTILLPEVLVLMFTSNNQSVDGVAKVMRLARAALTELPYDRQRLLAVPVPARDERNGNESTQARKWLPKYEATFGELYRDWLPKGVSARDALDKLYIPYVAAWSFGERLPVIEEPAVGDPASISAAYGRLETFLRSRLDWSALSLKAGEVHELDAAKEQAARATQEASRIKKWTRIAAGVLVAAFAAWLFYSDYRSTQEKQVARADKLLTAATAAEDPLAAQLLIAELGNLPQPDNGIARARSVMPAIAPLAVVGAASVKSDIVHVRLSANGSHVAAVYADGSTRYWPADGRGDAKELHTKFGQFQDLALGKDLETIRAAVVNDDERQVLVVDMLLDGEEKQIGQGSTAVTEKFISAEFVARGRVLVVEGDSGQPAARKRAAVWPSDLPEPLSRAIVWDSATFDVSGRAALATYGDDWYLLSFDDNRAQWMGAVQPDTHFVYVHMSEPHLFAVASDSSGGSAVVVAPVYGADLLTKFRLADGFTEKSPVLRLDETSRERVEICAEYVVVLSQGAELNMRARTWKLDGPWPERLSDATALRQRRPWLAIHDVSADGTKLATASADGSIWVWTMEEPHDLAAKDWATLVRWARESTTACLTVDQRMRLLGESYEDAVIAYEKCERSFDRTPQTPPKTPAEQAKK